MIPSSNINELNEEIILKKLNSKKCFNFNYEPQEKDYLLTTEKPINIKEYSHIHPYICFEFSQNKWKINYFLDKDIILNEIKKGKVKTNLI